MDHFSCGGADQQSGTSFEGGELVHEVDEEDLLERVPTQSGQGVDLGHKIFVLVHVLREPLHSLEESLGDGEQVEVVHELGQWLLVVLDQLGPPLFWGVIEWNFVSEWHVTMNRSHSWNDCALNNSQQKNQCNNW